MDLEDVSTKLNGIVKKLEELNVLKRVVSKLQQDWVLKEVHSKHIDESVMSKSLTKEDLWTKCSYNMHGSPWKFSLLSRLVFCFLTA